MMKRNLLAIAVAIFAAIPIASHADVYREAEGKAKGSDYDGAYRLLKDALLSKSFVSQSNALSIVRRHPQIMLSGIREASRSLMPRSSCETLSSGIAEAKYLIVEYIGEISPDDRVSLAEEFDKVAQSLNTNPNEGCKSKGQEVADLSNAIHARVTEEGRKASNDAEVQAKTREIQLQRAGIELEEIQKRANLISQAEQSGKKAVFTCKNTLHCQKAFSVAQIFINENADMKIELANDTIIETHKPIKATSFYAKVVKMPRAGTQSEIRLTLICRSDLDSDRGISACHSRRMVVYELFPIYMRQNVLE